MKSINKQYSELIARSRELWREWEIDRRHDAKLMEQAAYTIGEMYCTIDCYEKISDEDKRACHGIGNRVVPMTLDEAIEHAEERACDNDQCAKDHAQLADWLRELRRARMEIDLLKTLRDGFKADAQKYKAENANLRELARKYSEYTSQDRCEGCVCKARCNNGDVDECWQLTKIRELERELGIEVE